MQITEMFKSIQGESTYAGVPCIFIRLTGCNLRCTWCDTEYAFFGGEDVSLDEVAKRVASLGGKLVEITGGEPLLQEEVYPLMDRLLQKGYDVMLETSGERKIDRIPPEVVKIVDVKCPDSGEANSFAIENLEHLAPHDQVKFVILTRRDYEFSRDFTRERRLAERVNAVIFSPVHGELDSKELAEWMLADGLAGVRLGCQLHKIIWGADAQGV